MLEDQAIASRTRFFESCDGVANENYCPAKSYPYGGGLNASNRERLRLFLSVLAACFLSTAGAFATTYYVSPTGNDTNPGTSAAPFATIRKAADIAQAGATVIIRDGTYAQSATLTFANSGTASQPITFIAEHAGRAIVTGPPSGNAVTFNSPYHVWDGLDVEGGPSGGIRVNAAYVTIQNGTIAHSAGTGISPTANAGSLLVQNNQISNHAIEGIHILHGADDITIRNNSISANGVNGIDVDPSNEIPTLRLDIESNLIRDNGSRGIVFEIVSQSRIANNLIINNRAIELHHSSDNNLIINNTVVSAARWAVALITSGGHNIAYPCLRNVLYGNILLTLDGSSALLDDAQSPVYASDYNVFWSGPGRPVADGRSLVDWQRSGYDLHSVNADPLFVNQALSDLHLQSASPAIGLEPVLTGDIRPVVDFDGNPRRPNFPTEAGAFVYTGNQAPTVATPARASPNPVNGTTTSLSVLGADDNGEANLTYTWAVTNGPSGATFRINGTNDAKNTAVTFTQPGIYTFQATISDAGGLSVTSSVNVTVVDHTAPSAPLHLR